VGPDAFEHLAALPLRQTPRDRRHLGVPEFDAVWAVYADTSEAVRAAGSRRLADAMLSAPTRFSWRTHEKELLLWKRDGRDSALQLVTCLAAVLGLLGLDDLSTFDYAP
jgi:hypothetical protein